MHYTNPPELGPMVAPLVPRDSALHERFIKRPRLLAVLDTPITPREMTSNPSHERSGCFSGLLAGSRWQRGCQSVPLQEESTAPLAPQESSHGKSLPGDIVGVL